MYKKSIHGSGLQEIEIRREKDLDIYWSDLCHGQIFYVHVLSLRRIRRLYFEKAEKYLKTCKLRNVKIRECCSTDLTCLLDAIKKNFKNPPQRPIRLDIRDNEINSHCIEQICKLIQKRAIVSLAMPEGLESGSTLEIVRSFCTAFADGVFKIERLDIKGSILTHKTLSLLSDIISWRAITKRLDLRGCLGETGFFLREIDRETLEQNLYKHNQKMEIEWFQTSSKPSITPKISPEVRHYQTEKEKLPNEYTRNSHTLVTRPTKRWKGGEQFYFTNEAMQLNKDHDNQDQFIEAESESLTTTEECFNSNLEFCKKDVICVRDLINTDSNECGSTIDIQPVPQSLFDKLFDLIKSVDLEKIALKQVFDDARHLSRLFSAIGQNQKIRNLELDVRNNNFDDECVEELKKLIAQNLLTKLRLPQIRNHCYLEDILSEFHTTGSKIEELNISGSVLSESSIELLQSLISKRIITTRLDLRRCKAPGHMLTVEDYEKLTKALKHARIKSGMVKQLEIVWFEYVESADFDINDLQQQKNEIVALSSSKKRFGKSTWKMVRGRKRRLEETESSKVGIQEAEIDEISNSMRRHTLGHPTYSSVSSSTSLRVESKSAGTFPKRSTKFKLSSGNSPESDIKSKGNRSSFNDNKLGADHNAVDSFGDGDSFFVSQDALVVESPIERKRETYSTVQYGVYQTRDGIALRAWGSSYGNKIDDEYTMLHRSEKVIGKEKQLKGSLLMKSSQSQTNAKKNFVINVLNLSTFYEVDLSVSSDIYDEGELSVEFDIGSQHGEINL